MLFLGIILGMALIAALWAAARFEKYPLAPGLPPVNLFVVPAGVLRPGLVQKLNALMGKMPLPPLPEGLARQTMEIDGPGGTRLPLTLYAPAGAQEPLPGLVYLHGGGFCFTDSAPIQQNAMQYALSAGCRVVCVNYRTSDRDPFPAPFEDACAALRYVWDNADELGIDRARLAIGGDSAGGALAASCAQWARDCTDIRLCFQLLIYPVTDDRMETASMRSGSDTPCWNAKLNRRMWEMYLRGGPADPPAWAAPMRAERFSDLPPAYVEVEQYDCLHDEGVNYAIAMRDAGVPVQLEDVPGTYHGFDINPQAKIAQKMIARRAEALRQAFDTETSRLS